MYAVIFRAEINELDPSYSTTAPQIRDLAMSKYGCLDFTAFTEGKEEIAISYWPSLEHISAWNNDPEHKEAQKRGREIWYKNYNVQIVKVVREYSLDLEN